MQVKIAQLTKLRARNGARMGPPRWFVAVALALLGTIGGVGGLLAITQHSAPIGEANGTVVQVMGYVNQWDPARDPLVTLPDGSEAKASNVYGIEIGGVHYHYQLTHHLSFDPVRLGVVTDYEVVALVDAGTLWEVLIYTVAAD